jgi:transposase-like protein
MGKTLNRPVPGQDYPQTLSQFMDWFATNDSCLCYLEQLRWSKGFICPHCGSTVQPYRASRNRFICHNCDHQSTVTAGTIFDKTRTPLKSWLAAAWYITNQKQGVSALGLQRVLGLNSYQTAWTMLHRFRRAMVRPGRECLKENVEVDETYIAITARNQPKTKEGRKCQTTKTLVAVAVETLEPKGFGRIRLRRIPSDSEQHLLPFVRESVEPGSRVRTDGASGYRSLSKHGYLHDPHIMAQDIKPAHISMPAVHRVASLVKRWLLGTHHGAVQPNQLDYYLDEFVFRFNRRSSRSRGLLFYRLLQQSVLTQPVTYQHIANKARNPEIPLELAG